MMRLGIGLEEWETIARALGKAPAELRRELRKKYASIGRVARAAMRAEFGPRVTDPHTRRRPPGPKLGRFTGHARQAIGVRQKIQESSGRWKIFIGPPGGAGIPGRGFYLAFHEFGTTRRRKMPIRPVAAPVDRRLRPWMERETEDVLYRILAGF